MNDGVSDVPVLETRGVWKHFGAAEVLCDVSLKAYSGRVLALLGDNGAGKSTLIKILSGVIQPSRGEIRVRGALVKFSDPRDARQLGIATVFQDLAICNLLSITRNIILGREPTKRFGPFSCLDMKKANDLAGRALNRMGMIVEQDLTQLAGSMSGGQKQSLAISRAILFGSSCLILDEPTSALAVRQAAKVLELVRAAADEGQAVILITHNFYHALSVADDIAVLGRGRIISTYKKGEIDLEGLTTIVARAS